MSGASHLAVGFHTGAFHSAYISFEQAVKWAAAHGVHGIECGFIDGVTWNHGLGYFPHVAAWESPKQIRELLDANGVVLSQIDAAFPLSGRPGAIVAVPYIIHAVRWAADAGCPMVDTTDGLHRPEGIDDEESMAMMRESYLRIVEEAERYDITVTIETHGYFTANADRMAQMLDFVDSARLRMTMDTGNVFISGGDPADFLGRFLDRTAHVHIKDVAPRLAEARRGRETGIGMSRAAIGEGVNAQNIDKCLLLLKQAGWRGAVSLECDADGGPVLERSLAWVRERLDAQGIAHDLTGGGVG